MRTTWLVAVLLASLSYAEEKKGFPSKDQKELAKHLEPDEVSSDARRFLKSKMKSHGKDMREVVMAVAQLKYEAVKAGAQGIANAPRLDASAGPAAKLPEKFFVIQDQLRKQAAGLVEAADKHDVEALSTSFDGVIKTCMTCHALLAAGQAAK